MQFVNLTPHAIHLPGLTVEPSGAVARCKESTIVVGHFGGVDLTVKEYGQVEGLPEPKENTMYIVSMLVRLGCPDRRDIASPGDLVRDDKGQIIGAKNLAVNF